MKHTAKVFCLSLITAGVATLSALASAGPSRAPELTRLEGSWTTLDGPLRERLTFTEGSHDDSPLELSLNDTSPPRWLTDSLQAGETILGGGKLKLGARKADFWLATRQGRFILFMVPPGRESALEMYVQWVPSVHAAEDLLLLGGAKPLDPYFPHERTLVAERLSESTRTALRNAVNARGTESTAQMRELAQRPDWAAAVEYLELDVRTMPTGKLNNPCLALAQIVEARLDEVKLDVAALSRAVEEASSSAARSKCARVLANAALRPELFEGAEATASRALIRRLTSQHSLEVTPALTALEHLTGKDFGRDPETWARWFEKRFGKPLDFATAVKQRVHVVDVTKTEEGSSYVVDGERIQQLSALKDRLNRLSAEAHREELEPNLVIRIRHALPKGHQSPAQLPGVGAVLAIARKVGFGEISVAQPEVEIYPPWHPTE